MEKQEYILTQDIGIFSCKAALFRLNGEIVRQNTVYYQPCHNEQGWCWESPEVWWESFCKNCKTLLLDIPPESVRVVSLCGQMMSCLCVDENIRPLGSCITWDDKRSIQQTQLISTLLDPVETHRITGTPPLHSSSLSKILWLKQCQPEIYEKSYRFIQCKDYINYLLTGHLVTDETDAGFTQMYDLFEKHWSDRILDACGIDRSKLPEVIPSGTPLGRVTPQASAQCGLSPQTLVVEGVGDGRAPAIGSGILNPGEGCIHLSSSSWISQVTRSREIDTKHAITKASYIQPDTYVNGGTILSGHLCADWYLKTFFNDQLPPDKKDWDQFMAQELARTTVGSKGLLFMPYLRGERAPWYNTYAKGGFIGLTSRHTRYDFYRSILEGVSFQLALVKNSIEALEPFTSLRLVGNGVSPQWQQILSDVLEMDLISSDVTTNVGCVGVAMLAGVAAGIYSDHTSIARFHHNQFITTPIQEHVEVYQELIPAFEDCYLALQDINQHLSQINLPWENG